MGVSKHRKKHKEKVKLRKEKIIQQKNMYKKFMQKQMAAIQEQMANKQSTAVNIGTPDGQINDTAVDIKTASIQQELDSALKNLEQAADGIK